MNRAARHPYLFHPITVLGVSLFSAGIFALLVSLIFDGEFRWFLLYYFTPVGISFVAFLFDRAEQYPVTPKTKWAIDLVVLVPALIRAFIRIPLISGHAIFLVYSFFTSRSRMARLTALLVFLQVTYLKVFVTHDTALIGGVVAGCAAALIYRRIQPVRIETRGAHET